MHISETIHYLLGGVDSLPPFYHTALQELMRGARWRITSLWHHRSNTLRILFVLKDDCV